MKCPTCGDTEKQQRLDPHDGGSIGYRCSACGRLYRVPGDDLDRIRLRLDEMKANAEELRQRREVLLTRIAETEAQIRDANE